MGQKVHPIAFRLGINKADQGWLSQWYFPGDFRDVLIKDWEARQFLEKELVAAGISRIVIERPARNARIVIYSARPGVIIGKKGEDVEKLRNQLMNIMGVPVHLTIEEVRKPELDAKLVATNIAQQLEKRVLFRRAMKRAVASAMRAGAKGIKVCVSGRLGGAEIARTEWQREGRVPLHTLRANIDYSVSEAKTTYGIIGVKVWIFKGEMLDGENANPSNPDK